MSEEIKIYNPNKERSEREKQISEFIIFNDNSPEEIDHAVGSISYGETKKRYFGIFVKQRIPRADNKGKIYTSIEDVPAIITEDRLIMSKSAKPEGYNFRFSSTMTLKRNRWEYRPFITNTELDIPYKEAYESFKKCYDLNMVYEEPETYEFNALWDLLTYHWDLVDKALIIKEEGMSGTAKSKGMKISANLSFNGRKWLRPNPANFFRYRNYNKATIYLEEAERLFDDTKKKQSGDDELVEYLNASYEKGNFVPRQNDKNINQTDEFDPFGFTRIASIKALQGALEKRSITQTMIKARKDDYRGNTEIPTEKDSMYAESRDKAYISSLLHYKEFLKALESIKNTYDLANREWLLAKPILALAHCINPELETRIGKYIQRHFSIRDDTFDETSWRMIMAKILLVEACKSKSEVFISNTDVKKKFQEKTDPYKDISPHAVSKIITKDLWLSGSKCRDSKGDIRGYKLSFDRLCDIFSRNQLYNSFDIIKIVSEVSECQYKDEDIINLCSDTILTDILTVSKDNLTVLESVRKNEHNLTVGHFSEGGGVSNFVILPFEKVDFGLCGYCGKNKQLTYKDDKGNYSCSYCAGDVE